MMLDAVYIDMKDKKAIISVKAKPVKSHRRFSPSDSL
jgi:hypothetical protein